MFGRSKTYVLLPACAAYAFSFAVLLLSPVRAQDGEAGKNLFERRCGGCHAIDTDKEGPKLRGIHGRAAASSSFLYSDALKKSGIVWTDQTLDQWLADPEKLVPDNDMAYRLEKPDERSAIIAYLKQNSK